MPELMDKENEKISRTISNLLSLAPKRQGRKKVQKSETPVTESGDEDKLVRKVVDRETEERTSGEGVDYKERFENLLQEYQREREKLARILDENDELEAKVEELEKKVKFNEKYIAILKEGADS